MPWGKGVHRFIPTLTWQCRPQLERLVAQFEPDALIIDLGAGGRRIAPHVKTVDFTALPDTDVVADVTRTPFRNKSFDFVIATGLLEHVENENALMMEIVRILKDGGTVHIELPFLQQYHEDPIDCRRLTLPGLERFIVQHGLKVVSSGAHIGPTVTIVTLISYYMAMIFEGQSNTSKILSNGVFFILSSLFFPLKYLDAILINKKSAHRLAFGIYCTAAKPSSQANLF